MRALIINAEMRAEINSLIERAMDKVIPIETVQKLALPFDAPEVRLEDRPPDFQRPESEFVIIPHGYRASLSFEQQPMGVCKHLSISVDTPGKIPNVPAVHMIMEAFGMRIGEGKAWLEEFEPGHHAVNIVQLS